MQTLGSSPKQNSPDETLETAGVSITGPAQVTARDIFGGDEYVGYSAAQVTLLLEKIRTEYQVKAFDGHSPYVGLEAFQERDADRFFGRETLIAELVKRVVVYNSISRWRKSLKNPFQGGFP